MSVVPTPDAEEPPKRRWLWFILAMVALLGVLTFVWEAEDTADVTDRVSPAPAPVVSVIAVDRAVAKASISVFAELKPRWDAQIRAAVSGRIVEVHDAALAGTRVTEGTPLFSIQSTQFETAVAEAEVALEQARLTHLQARNQVSIAERQFARDASDPPNDLALKLPQLRIAERGLDAAQKQLAAARRQLDDTQVSAPFSGFVTERLASLGQTVTAGEALLHLSDDQHFELVANLSQAEWSMLDHPIEGKQAPLFNRTGDALGFARVRKGGGFLNPDTQQMRVFLDVSVADAAVLSGDFIQIEFDGRMLENTLTVPGEALTRSGHMWFVDDRTTLVRHAPEILFRDGGTLTIAAPDGPGPWHVAKTPLASFLPGQKVTPRLVEG
ncbi:MAG: efflux RND transporter periplasmic adaptor subunit [Pseudomonadota bacterium]